MDGDLLTKLNFAHLLDVHRDHESLATLCVREYNMQMLYGIIETD